MPPLETHLNSLNFSTNLEVVKNLIDKAEAKTTFWGSRVIKVAGYTGSIYLDDLAKKIIDAGRQRCEADDLQPAERVAGIDIVKKLRNFYEVTDTQIRNSNFFTRFLNWLREFSFDPYTIRFYIEKIGGTAEDNFRGYSDAKFLQQFGGAFDAQHEHPASDGWFAVTGLPSRTLAREESIRALLNRV
jgi:hypothetical protein